MGGPVSAAPLCPRRGAGAAAVFRRLEGIQVWPHLKIRRIAPLCACPWNDACGSLGTLTRGVSIQERATRRKSGRALGRLACADELAAQALREARDDGLPPGPHVFPFQRHTGAPRETYEFYNGLLFIGTYPTWQTNNQAMTECPRTAPIFPSLAAAGLGIPRASKQAARFRTNQPQPGVDSPALIQAAVRRHQTCTPCHAAQRYFALGRVASLRSPLAARGAAQAHAELLHSSGKGLRGRRRHGRVLSARMLRSDMLERQLLRALRLSSRTFLRVRMSSVPSMARSPPIPGSELPEVQNPRIRQRPDSWLPGSLVSESPEGASQSGIGSNCSCEPVYDRDL